MTSFQHNEKYLSQIPALQLLANLGYHILRPEEALKERSGWRGNVLLENILARRLQEFNRIRYRGGEYRFSEANIQEAVRRVKHVQYDGLQRTNEAIYNLITLGTTLEQVVEGDRKSYTLNYIDWRNPAGNIFHAVPEFAVEHGRGGKIAVPDIVLFINGIPLAVIECKSPDVDIGQAVSQNIRNQEREYIPKLFTYVQLVMAVNKNEARYATVGTKAKFWSIWREREDKEERIARSVNRPLDAGRKEALFSGGFASARVFFDEVEQAGERIITEQDRAVYSLCRPERLMELSCRFIIFDAGIKKIARYQQFFVIRSTLARIRPRKDNGVRAGGIIWHTQGSGKSLTMVMLARALALDPEIRNHRIILVTDRDDLDRQLSNTFSACGLSRQRATSGRNLVKHLKNKVGIITTLIHKFDKGWVSGQYTDESPDIFVLVDESHRTNFGVLSSAMRRMLPNACFIGFTGTPLLKKERSSFVRFGDLIEPHYSIRQAVKDKAVVPLLYEARHVEMEQDQDAIDLWFDRHTAGLNEDQRADLKRKYARAEMLNKSDRVIYMRAFDVSEHYRANWKGSGFKAQLVAPSKATALKYHEHFNDIDLVTSAVMISAPDTREGHEEVDEEGRTGPNDAVREFWAVMMQRYGGESEYTRQVIDRFKNADEPEILIVVDKLLTGFDAPRNTVLYICRTLRGHTLLQAIARVNRLHDGKEYGFIVDYPGLLGEMDKALTMYDAFEGFNEEDLAETLTSIDTEVGNLPQRYSDLWDVFRRVKNRHDEEEFEVLLADDELRDDFYERLARYGKTLGIALGTEKFIMETDEGLLRTYKNDLKRFENLRRSVQMRYAETIDYRDYELKIKKLLDTHIQADEVIRLNEPVNIFDDATCSALKRGEGRFDETSTAARADAVAHAVKKVIHERMDEDPAFNRHFSDMIQKAIDDFRDDRISDLEYLNRVSALRDEFVSGRHNDVPESISGNGEASAYYGLARDYFAEKGFEVAEKTLTYMACSFQEAFDEEHVVDFWDNEPAINRVKEHMDDFFYDELRGKHRVPIKTEHMDEIIKKTMNIAKSRSHHRRNPK